ncbi:cysteine proteinase, partial [Glonium stellatum]
KDPQQTLNEFWDSLITKKPGKVTTIFPPSLYANLLPPRHKPGASKGKNAAESYEAAAEECRNKVQRIVRECERTNEKFTDPDFDIEGDFGTGNCLKGLLSYYDEDSGGSGGDSGPSSSGPVSLSRLRQCLSTLNDSGILSSPTVSLDLDLLSKYLNDGDGSSRESRGPGSVHRVDWIYENPSFVVDGYSSSDVRQGGSGDCWWIAAVATLCSLEKLMDKVCVVRNEECGVYGFVFHRDGEWISTVIDDNLYLLYDDFDTYGDTYDASGEKERKYKKNHQTGSDALYFAKCADPNETWLPLLEKAYAKVHGDYKAISGGISGEAVEDMTGGVTTNIMTNKILSKERLWKELLNVNKQFIFAASSPSLGPDNEARRGLALSHAYSVLKAVEEEDEDGKKVRLVLIRNPWGRRTWNGVGEWNGPWSDGSKEWTPYWMNKLNHRFGDDGEFWMSYDDLRSKFDMLDRTRLFDREWTVVQQWTSVNVAWVTGYLNTKFLVEIKTAGPTVFVLSQV